MKPNTLSEEKTKTGVKMGQEIDEKTEQPIISFITTRKESTTVEMPPIITEQAPSERGESIPTWRGHYIWSILTTLCCFGPLSVIGLVHFISAKAEYARGNIREAFKRKRQAKCWSLAAATVGLIAIVAIITCLLIGGYRRGYHESLRETNALRKQDAALKSSAAKNEWVKTSTTSTTEAEKSTWSWTQSTSKSKPTTKRYSSSSAPFIHLLFIHYSRQAEYPSTTTPYIPPFFRWRNTFYNNLPPSFTTDIPTSISTSPSTFFENTPDFIERTSFTSSSEPPTFPTSSEASVSSTTDGLDEKLTETTTDEFFNDYVNLPVTTAEDLSEFDVITTEVPETTTAEDLREFDVITTEVPETTADDEIEQFQTSTPLTEEFENERQQDVTDSEFTDEMNPPGLLENVEADTTTAGMEARTEEDSTTASTSSSTTAAESTTLSPTELPGAATLTAFEEEDTTSSSSTSSSTTAAVTTAKENTSTTTASTSTESTSTSTTTAPSNFTEEFLPENFNVSKMITDEEFSGTSSTSTSSTTTGALNSPVAVAGNLDVIREQAPTAPVTEPPFDEKFEVASTPKPLAPVADEKTGKA